MDRINYLVPDTTAFLFRIHACPERPVTLKNVPEQIKASHLRQSSANTGRWFLTFFLLLTQTTGTHALAWNGDKVDLACTSGGGSD